MEEARARKPDSYSEVGSYRARFWNRNRPGLAFSSIGSLLAILLFAGPASAQRTQTIVEGLDFPAGIAFLNDARMLVTERSGALRVVDKGRLLPEPLATIPTVISGETGLLGIAVGPDQRAVFAFATAPDGASNEIWRVPLNGGEPEVVIADLPAASIHNGGGVAIADDGMLFVSHGEQGEAERAQEVGSLGGKVYRFTPEGDVPEDNPFSDSPVFSLGHRNPFGIAIDPIDGTPWVTENGPTSFDEINRIEAGGNYGWPVISGPDDAGRSADLETGEYHDPVIAYEDIIVPTGITFATRDGAGGVGRGDLFFGAYGDSTIHHLTLDESRTEVVEDDVIEVGEAVVAVAWGPRGLYYSTPNAVKLIPYAPAASGGDGSPSSRASSAEPTPAPSPTATGDEDDPISPAFVIVLVALGAAFFWTRGRIERRSR